MAKKNNFLSTMTTRCAVVAATAAVYHKREELRELFRNAKECFCGDRTRETEPEGWEDGEGDIVIYMSEVQQMQEKEENG